MTRPKLSDYERVLDQSGSLEQRTESADKLRAVGIDPTNLEQMREAYADACFDAANGG